jgi:beta-1,4-mannosyltransferase
MPLPSVREHSRLLPPVSALFPRRIAPFPSWFENNPYLNIHYLVSRTRGYDIVTATRLGPLYDYLATMSAGDVVHVHWTAPIAQHAATARDAADRADLFVRRISEAQRRGVRLFWTIHNKVPHDCPYPDVEREVLGFLAREADLVIAINPLTAELMADVVTLDPDRLVHLPHPSYRGLYADHVTREEARERLGIAQPAHAVLFFGQMRRYKGLETFFEAMRRVHQDDAAAVMLLAGKTSDRDQAWIDEKLPASVPSVRDHRFVPDDEVQLWMRAADAVVLPFQTVLNSGSLFLGPTFGRSVIVPKTREIEAQLAGEPWVRYFDPEDPVESLSAAIVAEIETTQNPNPDAVEFSRRRTAFRMALEFDEHLRRFE